MEIKKASNLLLAKISVSMVFCQFITIASVTAGWYRTSIFD